VFLRRRPMDGEVPASSHRGCKPCATATGPAPSIQRGRSSTLRFRSAPTSIRHPSFPLLARSASGRFWVVRCRRQVASAHHGDVSDNRQQQSRRFPRGRRRETSDHRAREATGLCQPAECRPLKVRWFLDRAASQVGGPDQPWLE